MLIRSVVPQVASRDNLSTSFGLVESGLFLGSILLASVNLTFLNELVYLVINLMIFTFIMYKVSDKWQQLKQAHRAGHVEEGRFGELTEPLHGRGG